MAIERILLVNDDVDDIAEMQKKIFSPEVEAMSQRQVRRGSISHDLVVLDNDANNRQESKGAKTLEKLRENRPDVPVVYTSFQPGWVPEGVREDENVAVVRTDQVLDYLIQNYGVRLRDLAAPKDEGKRSTTILVTYNDVSGHRPGVYGDSKLLIVSYNKMARDMGREVMRQHLDKIYKDFDWRADRDVIKNVFVYDGVNGGDIPARVASALGHDIRMKVNLLACHCEWERKKRFASNMYVNLIKVGCGGSDEMGLVADTVLGINRPKKEHLKDFPVFLAEEPAERFKIY